ncbi:PASTA domain-containing protein [Streptococcus ovuberis]|uniref:PASTA domain-containing protein n=1 Tax=Streptococcus ovuberis TaxID=1936207 RepID=A0A7X6MZA0_9STRE|nr:PASTA domain-containing protein [Streptococcus ovuberis]NKZ20528.1 PASTA domain-containing protein [Streptococcus ovuberis]
MSDFLSKFSGQNYDELLENDQKEHSNEEAKPVVPKAFPVEGAKAKPETKSAEPTHPTTGALNSLMSGADQPVSDAPSKISPSRPPRPTRATKRYEVSDDYELDPTYHKRQKRKYLIWSGLGLLGLLACVFLYFKMTRVTMPDFTGKPVTDARAWGVKHNVDFSLEQKFSLEQDVNQVISQAVKPGKSVKKGGTINLVVSLGADPDEILSLPDFAKMTTSQAEKWISEHKAENLILKREFDETVDADHFIRLDITSSGVTRQDYKRGNKATLYYSRGQEKLEKNIEIPDFAGKTKTDVEAWAKKNELKVTYTDQANETATIGNVLSQSLKPGDKISKKDAFEVFVSAGKGVAVPDFATLSPDVAGNAPGLTVTVKYQFNPNLRYGTLISQSIEAGKQLTEKESKNVVVIYSQGTPYLKDLRGKNASELAKYFFDEFQSRSAEVTYETYWVDSAQPRGTVVEQSEYETPIPMAYHVYLGVSNGAWSNHIPTTGQQQDPITEGPVPATTVSEGAVAVDQPQP